MAQFQRLMGTRATVRHRVSLLPGRRVRGRRVSLPRLTQVTSPSPRFLCFGAGLLLSSLSLQAMLLGRWFDSRADILWGRSFPGVLRVSRGEDPAITESLSTGSFSRSSGQGPAHREGAAGTSRQHSGLQVWDLGPVPAQPGCVTWAGRGPGVALSLLYTSVCPPAHRGSESVACEDAGPSRL